MLVSRLRERYAGRQDYLDRVKQAADDLVRQRFMRARMCRQWCCEPKRSGMRW